MHAAHDPLIPNPPSGELAPKDDGRPWFMLLNRYHWFVMMVAALGWLFDCLDQQLFVLARPAAMRDLLKGVPKDAFESYSQAVLAAVPAGVDSAPLSAFLAEIKAKLPDAERGRFWQMAHSLRADVASPPGGSLEPAITKARDTFQLATDAEKNDTLVKVYGGYATSIFLIGWASGGLLFGMMGDRIGRAKTMMITILMYSVFTGLSSLSVQFWDFAAYRFLTGLGVGGEFAVGVALLAEVMPDRARPYALALLQMLSALGNVAAAGINMGMGVAEGQGLVSSPWRLMFIIGSVPALLALLVRWKLREPEAWQKVKREQALSGQLGSYAELLGNPRWRRNAIVGLLLAFSGVVGLWAVGFFAPDLTDSVMRPQITAEVFRSQIAEAQAAGLSERAAGLETLRTLAQEKKPAPPELKGLQGEFDKKVSGSLTFWRGVTSIMIQVGAFFGMFGFGIVAQKIGRIPTFAIAFLAAFISTAGAFKYLDEFSELYWMMPIMGFCQLSLFAGYAMYFPELFPTHLRSTGTSFCYNVGRFVAASGPFVQGELNRVFSSYGEQSMRYAGITMCVVFLVGLAVLPFAPETRGKPLPD